jgi:DNA polymerase-1
MEERYLLGIALKTDHNSWYVPVNHQPYLGKVPNNFILPADLFEGYSGPIIAHNMKFDYIVLKRHGLELPVGNLWCTLMLSVYIDENKTTGHDLDAVLERFLGARKKTVEAAMLKKFGWVNAPVHYMAQYAEQDSQLLPELYDALLDKSQLQHIQLWEQTDRDFMLLLAEIEMNGILIDRELCAALKEQCQVRLREIQSQLGFDPAKPSQLHPKLFSDPPMGLGLRASSFTPTGKPQVSLEWLQGIGHPVTALVYEYRKISKQLSSYFSAYLDLTTRENPRLHPNFKQHGTETGRLSCENPNLQQIPREEYKDASVKKLFLPEPGKELWEIDYRTIEYRLQAVYAQSSQLLSLFENEGDFHQLVADDVSRKAGIPITRQRAKTINYLMSFGGGPKVLQAQLGTSFGVAKEIHEAYRAAYPEIFDKAYEAQQVAEADMQIDNWEGRTRHFIYPGEAHKAFNAVIQGGSFAIVKQSMLKLHKAGFNIANQVHDSVWLNVNNEKEVEEAEEIMSGWTKETFGLTFRTDRKMLHGKNVRADHRISLSFKAKQ